MSWWMANIFWHFMNLRYGSIGGGQKCMKCIVSFQTVHLVVCVGCGPLTVTVANEGL